MPVKQIIAGPIDNHLPVLQPITPIKALEQWEVGDITVWACIEHQQRAPGGLLKAEICH